MATRTRRATKRKAAKAATSLPVRTAATRLMGTRPSRTKAFLTASAVAISGAVLVYRLLRGGDDD